MEPADSPINPTSLDTSSNLEGSSGVQVPVECYAQVQKRETEASFLTTDNLPKLSILIVSFNTKALTLACLESIRRFPPQGPYEIIVIDNDSKDGSCEAIREKYPETHLIQSGGNLGFARANNLGMREATGDILVLLNSDTEVHADALTHLQKAFHADRDMAAGGGRLLNTDGTQQFGIRYFPRLSNALSEALFLHHLFHGPWAGELESRTEFYLTDHEVEWLSGAYLAVRNEWYERIGGLDWGFFMYAEDSDWCYRIRKQGGKIRYVADSIVTHHGGGSSEAAGKLDVIRTQAKDRFVRLHFAPWRAFIFRLILVFGLLFRCLLALPLCPLGEKYRRGLAWRARAALTVFTSPLPLETHYD